MKISITTASSLLLSFSSFYTLSDVAQAFSFVPVSSKNVNTSSKKNHIRHTLLICNVVQQSNDVGFGGFFKNIFSNNSSDSNNKRVVAHELVRDLVENQNCYSTEEGARAFLDACSENVEYNDTFYKAAPFIGKEAVLQHMLSKVAARKNQGSLRLDRISDGSAACGFAWTYVSGEYEGLRGTTFVELNKDGLITFIQEIPEPLFKPGSLTSKLLEAVTKGATPQPPSVYTQKTPTTASDIARYLFKEVNGDLEESMRFFDDNIFYRDFNFEEPLTSTQQVRDFIQEFTFPGIFFNYLKGDDGINSTSFTWEVLIEGQEGSSVKGISLYEINPQTKKIEYVRDVPESPIKPPPLGNLARSLNPGLGVFKGIKLGSRQGGK